MRLLRRKTQSGEPQPFAPQLFFVLIDAASLFCRCQFSLGILDPEPSKQQLSAPVCARHLANRRVFDRSAHDHLQERQSKLADLSLEAYQELLDANDNHPSLDQVDHDLPRQTRGWGGRAGRWVAQGRRTGQVHRAGAQGTHRAGTQGRRTASSAQHCGT